jgi:hypothetical protein
MIKHLKIAMNLYLRIPNRQNYNRHDRGNSPFNRPYTAPPHGNGKQEMGNTNMSRPSSNPNMYGNFQPNHPVQHINMMASNPTGQFPVVSTS